MPSARYRPRASSVQLLPESTAVGAASIMPRGTSASRAGIAPGARTSLAQAADPDGLVVADGAQPARTATATTRAGAIRATDLTRASVALAGGCPERRGRPAA